MIPLLTTLSAILFLSFPFAMRASGTVVINEIQVGGTEKATDEFVELYNAGDQGIDLTGWRLSKKTASGSLSNLLTEFPSVSIPAHGFLLIAHNDYTGAAAKDLAYSTQGSITSDNTVILYSDSGKTIVDLVGMGNASEGEGSNAVTPEPGQSIERKQIGSDGNNNANDFALSTVPTPKQGQTNQQDIGNGTQGSTSDEPGSTSSAPANNPNNQQSSVVVISELLPNPLGLDEEGEWIELTNLGNAEVDLSDWSFEDASGKHFTIRQGGSIASTTIAPGGYFVLPRTLTGISLNNTDSETVKLLSPHESTIAAVTYAGTAKDDYSWARDRDGNYAWTTTPTRGASNIITQPQIATKTQNQESTTAQGSNMPTSPAPLPAPVPSTLPPSLIISELLPNPAGDDVQYEWAELYNEGEDEIMAAGLILEDASGQKYALADDFIRLAAKSFVLITRPMSSIALNNGGDTIILRFYETELDRISFGAGKEGVAFAREGDSFSWTNTPTPGKENVFVMPTTLREEDEEDNTAPQSGLDQGQSTSSDLSKSVKAGANKKSNSKTTASDTLYQYADIADLRGLPKGTKVTVTGTVAVPPKFFGKTQFYLNGIQIYSVSYPYPDLKIGDLVKVSGTTSASGGEVRITVPKQGSILIIAQGEHPVPLPIIAETISDEYEGILITITGEVVEIKGTTVWIDDGTGEIRVVLKDATGLTGQDFVLQARYSITGIVSETSSGYRMLPRGQGDIKAESDAVLGASTESSPSSRSGGPHLYYIIAALAVMSIAAWVGIQKWRIHRQMHNDLSEN